MAKLYVELARKIDARLNCAKSGNTEWFDKHTDAIEEIIKNGPSGSGIDSGTSIDLDKSTSNKIVLGTSYHHMNEGGMYSGWTDHVVTVTPSLMFGFELKISGPNRNDIKEYLHDVYNTWLNEEE